MKPLLAALGVLVLLAILAASGSSASSGAASHAPKHDPPRFTSMSGLLTSDAAKISTDLGLVANDAANGQNGPSGTGCYNVVNNVTPDARAIGTFVVDDVNNDVGELQGDINTLEADIADFNQDIADFANDGVPTPDGATTVSQIRAVIAGQIASSNALIAAMQSNVSLAYADGNNLAYGPCDNDGPGNPPTILTVTS